MKQNIKIVPTSEAYAEILQQAVASVAKERQYLASLNGFTIEETAGFIKHLLSGGGTQYLALHAEQVVGWCDVECHRFEGFAHSAHLGMGVVASFRNQGIGKKLIEKTLSEAFNQGLTRIELEVYSSNEIAVNLYKRLGFVLEGTKKDAFKLDGKTDDILCMALLR